MLQSLPEADFEGGMCAGTDGGMSVDESAPFCEDFSVDGGGGAVDDTPPAPRPGARSAGSVQQGQRQAHNAANDGTTGTSGMHAFGEAPPEDDSGNDVFALEGDVAAFGATAGLQLSVVDDEECGFGLVGSANYGTNLSLGPLSGASASVMASYTAYDGSFEEYDGATQYALTAGDGVAGSARVYVNDQGEVIGKGGALGAGAGVSATGTKSTSVRFFPACPELNGLGRR